jgi:riboflavin kinase/FMN adenylyltransferase
MEGITVSGIVLQGKRLGRTLGFPTINLAIPKTGFLPQDGVYIGMATLGDGSIWPCILNQGKHPTLPEGEASIEAHLLGFDGDLYGQTVAIEYLEKLRPERHFPSVEALRAQIEKDKAIAEAWFAKNKKPSQR